MHTPAILARSAVRAALACALLLPPWQAALAQAASDASVKMAFVYNLAKFTEWPAPAGGAARQPVLCFAGEPEGYGPGLAAVEGRLLGGRELRVRRLGKSADTAGCQVVYIARSEERRVQELLAAHTHGALTVSDIADFAEAGGIIGFVDVDNKVQFEINLRSARLANVRISSEVLKLARAVIGK